MMKFITWLIQKFWRCPRGHLWRDVAPPFVRQCRRCGVTWFNGELDIPEGMKEYFATVQSYQATRMFPKSAVVGYHHYHSGCCPLEKDDPIHDPNNVSKLEQRFN